MKSLRLKRIIRTNWSRTLQIWIPSKSFSESGPLAFKQTCVSDPTTFAIYLNNLYSHFDTSDFTAECDSLLDSLPFQDLDYKSLLTRQDVYFQLFKCKPNKALGPDGIQGWVLKNCVLEWTSILHSLFLRSRCTSTISVKSGSDQLVFLCPKN